MHPLPACVTAQALCAPIERIGRVSVLEVIIKERSRQSSCLLSLFLGGVQGKEGMIVFGMNRIEDDATAPRRKGEARQVARRGLINSFIIIRYYVFICDRLSHIFINTVKFYEG